MNTNEQTKAINDWIITKRAINFIRQYWQIILFVGAVSIAFVNLQSDVSKIKVWADEHNSEQSSMERVVNNIQLDITTLKVNGDNIIKNQDDIKLDIREILRNLQK